MIKNYLLIAKRVLFNKTIFTILNVLGLAIGIASSAFIFHYIGYEKSFDKYHPDSENIYRLTYGRSKDNGDNVEFASACPVIAPLLKENFPEIKQIARMAVREATFAFGENKFIEKKIYYAEQEIFTILQFNIIKGSIENALNQPNKIVINKTIAEKYFGKTDPIGKSLKLNKLEDYEVVAVFEDVPSNSHLKPEILMSFPNLTDWRGESYLQSWGHTGAFTYLVLDSNANPRKLEEQFIAFTKSQIGELLNSWGVTMYFNLQAIEDIHLTSHLLQEQEVNGDIKSVNFMYIIGVFILIIAWVNYINLTTSRSMERAKEVGVRKVIGAVRKNLISQFYTEAALINLIGLAIAILFIELLVPAFYQLTGVPALFSIWSHSWFILFLAGTFLFGTFITGMYPVFALSSFKPVQILKGRFSFNKKGVVLRKAMVVFQLTISIILITGTYTVFTQLQYLRTQELGFEMNQTLVIKMPKAIDSTFIQKKESFKQEIAKLTGVNGVAFSTEVPGRKIWWDNGGIFKVGLDPSEGKNYMIMGVDDQFIDLYEMEFVNGRNFSREFPSDADALILNETAVKHLEFESPADALNSEVNYWGKIYKVIGVLKDYRHESPKAVPEPQIFRYLPDESRFGTFSVKLTTSNISDNIKQIEKLWKNLFSGNPFEYFFLDSYYNEQFDTDRKFGNVFGIFSSLAIFITCLGLFGLSLYTVQLKTKEIGLRKVHGATFYDIVKYILKEYMLLIFIALLIAIPILFWAIMLWLNNFPVKMAITIWLFIVPVLIVMLITMVSVASHTLKAARLNPVDTIKYE
jgi:putative ABC transport system permease protein